MAPIIAGWLISGEGSEKNVRIGRNIRQLPQIVNISFPARPAGAAGYIANERRLFPASMLLIKAIPRLYVAGEISSIYGHLYLEAGNITECFVAGKIAGQNPAAKKEWS